MPFTPLSEDTEFTFPAGAFDVRGWEVRTMVDGEKVGEIDDLLLDETGNLRYLDVDLPVYSKHALIPIGAARVDEAENVVWVPGIAKGELEFVPAYDHDPHAITPEYENRVGAAYAGTLGGAAAEHPGRLAAPPPPLPPRMRPRPTAPTGQLASMIDMGDYVVAAGEPDPQGWGVVTSDGREVGRVHDLIIDLSAMKVRYFDCELRAPEEGHPAGGRHILIPIGYARLDEGEKVVIVDAVTSEQVAGIPSFEGLPLTPEDEDQLYDLYANAVEERRRVPPTTGADRFYGRRVAPPEEGWRMGGDGGPTREGSEKPEERDRG